MKIAVVGTGYVGLVVGTGLAENGHFVTCVDRDPTIIEQLQAGRLPIYEPGLEELVVRNAEEDRLHFSTNLAEAVNEALLVFLCVGTPSLPNGEPDVSEVLAAAREVAQAMTGYRIIVNKSTCPVGATEQIRELIAGLTRHDFDVVVNPEFIKEGAAVDDFMRPDHIVVGCDDVRVEEIMKELYAPFLRTGKPFLTMDLRSAELTKYAVNTMIASRIAVINELANICEAYGADITLVREGVATDSRIGATYVFPGLGIGGSCLPKDVRAAARMAREKGVGSEILDAITAANERQQKRFIRRVLDFYGAAIAQKKLALWGATFKARTDDLRGSPALRVIDALLEAGAKVTVYDPVAAAKLAAIYGNKITISEKTYEVLKDADGLLVITEWREFHRPDFERMATLMREKVIFDGRNLFRTKVVADHGFRYFSIGRPSV